MIDFDLLKLNLWTWASRHLPLNVILTFDAELVEDNIFRVYVNGSQYEFYYETGNDETMQAIAAGLEIIGAVDSCLATASGEIGSPLDCLTITRKLGFDLIVTGAEIAMGASQANVTIDQNQQGLIIWANQNAPAPETDYLTIFIGPLEFIGPDYISPPNDLTELVSIRGTREFMVSLQGFGETAIERLYEIRQGLENPEILEQIWQLGLVGLNSGSIMDLTQIVGSRQEPSALLEVRMRIGIPYGIEATADLGIIETVEFGGIVEEN